MQKLEKLQIEQFHDEIVPYFMRLPRLTYLTIVYVGDSDLNILQQVASLRTLQLGDANFNADYDYISNYNQIPQLTALIAGGDDGELSELDSLVNLERLTLFNYPDKNELKRYKARRGLK